MSLNKPIYKLRDWIDKKKINWNIFSLNEYSIKVLEENRDKINWDYLTENENAIELLEKNPDKINWEYLCENPSIFTYDYEFLKERMLNTINEELIRNRFHPSNYNKWASWGFDDMTIQE